MSSTQVTVREMIERLSQFPPDMLVVLEDRHFDWEEYWEGVFNGPSEFSVVKVKDARTGMNPTCISGFEDWQWKVLLIRT